jgi:hypothetical protein
VATKIYESIELELLDGTSIVVKPLSIKNLREVMKSWGKAQTVESEDDFLEVLVECTQIAMRQFAPQLAEDREVLENSVDLQTMYKILEVGADIRLNDPNQLQVAQALVGMN